MEAEAKVAIRVQPKKQKAEPSVVQKAIREWFCSLAVQASLSWDAHFDEALSLSLHFGVLGQVALLLSSPSSLLP